jgi:hypothetical protein
MITQNRLDVILHENQCHKIRKQKGSLLPTGGRVKDFYTKPHKWHGKDQLIEVPVDVIDRLIIEHTPPGLFQFGTDAMVNLAQGLFETVGSPDVGANNGWAVFTAMMAHLP